VFLYMNAPKAVGLCYCSVMLILRYPSNMKCLVPCLVICANWVVEQVEET
jgi:hypothetical protein